MKNIFFSLCIFAALATFSQTPTSWQSRGIGGGGALFSPAFNPANPTEIYVACDMSELFHSTNGGQTWSETNFLQLQGGHDSKVNFTGTSGLIYCVDYISQNGIDYIRPMKSTNNGSTWVPLSGDPFGGFPGYPERMYADYNNGNRVILADYGSIYFSGNGGTSFTQIHTALNNGAGNHIAGVFFDGNNIYIGTNDGLIYSTNGGASFSTMTTSGITSGDVLLSFAGAREGTTVRFVCLTAATANVYAGVEGGFDYGIATACYTMDNANGTWVAKNGGLNVASDLVFFCGMAKNDVDTMYLSGGSSVGNPIVMRATFSTNWSHVFNSVNNVNIATGWCGQGGDRGWGYAEAPFGFDVCPTNSKMVMLSDFGFVHATSDAGGNWHQQYLSIADQNPAGTNTPTQKYYHGVGLENTSNWQVMWKSASEIYAPFSDINGVMSVDSGKSWKFIPNLTQNSVYRMVRDANTGILYAATSSVHDMYQSTRIYDAAINGGAGAVYFSTNNGVSFSVLHNFAHPVMWVALDPSNSNRMYAAVSNGSTNTGGIWVTSNLSAGASSTWTKMAKPPRSNGHAFNINVLSNGSLVVSFSARKPTTGTNFTDSSGVYFYDINTGTWSDRSDAGMHYWTKDVVVDPNDATESTWYAGVFSGWANVPSGTGGVYKTTNKGVSWTQISNSYRVNSVTINPSNAAELYFTTETDGLWYSSNATSGTPTFSQVTSYPFRHPVRVFYNPYKASEIWVSSFGNGMMVGDVNQTTSLKNIFSKEGSLTVYPNPASEEVFFKMDSPAKANLQLFDISGRVVFEKEINAVFSLDVTAFAAGLYTYRVQNGTASQNGKLIIQR